ncbi:MAG: electron transport complex subunit E [Clostridiales bacterium]|jgi:electron transport complex protein RnfE|nr:electron transport complex subunit E [Clostridiales bacterium]
MKVNVSEKLDTLTNGVIKSNPVFRLVLGTCPTLALTTGAMNGVYMGLSTTFCLLFSNVIISALRKVIPAKVRIPCYVVIIATLVTMMQMLIARFLPDVNEILGLYLPLIVVNCIILGRAEAYASSNTPGNAALDAIGMGAGFTLSLTLMGMVREFIGAGALFGVELGGMPEGAMTIFILPAGGFMVYGFMMAAFNGLYSRYENRKAVRERLQRQERNDTAGCHNV